MRFKNASRPNTLLTFRYIALASLVAFLPVVGSCIKKVDVPLPSPDSTLEVSPVSTNLKVDVYLDATLSMQGFTIPGETSYTRLLQEIEGAVLSGWPGAEARFFKFGSGIGELAGRQHLRAVLPSFYTDPEQANETHIEGVIDQADAGNLSVLVTDLFQTDADASLLTSKLKNKYIANGLAIGIVGLRSQFQGTVYDIGIRAEHFPYTGLRPFYVIILGKHSDVANYFERLQQAGIANAPEANFVIVSQHLVAPENATQLRAHTGVDQTADMISPGTRDGRIQQLRIGNGVKFASFEIAMNCKLLPFVWPFDNNRLDYTLVSKRFDGKKLVDSPEAVSSLALTSEHFSEESVSAQAKITTSGLPENSIHTFEISLFPNKKSYSAPVWISEWTMDTTRLAEWRRNPRSFDGSTTLNLKSFLTDLWQSVVEVRQPELARFYVYLRKLK